MICLWTIPTIAIAGKARTIEGIISDYGCGDSCYLTIIDNKGKEYGAVCAATPCAKWHESETVGSDKGKKVKVTIGKRSYDNGAGYGEHETFEKIIFIKDASNEQSDQFEPKRSKFSKCTLKVKGTTYINGPCMGSMDSDSFQINSSKYFAIVNLESKSQAIGYWNGEAYANHAHDDLGTLIRKGACWKNSSAIVCAWK